MDTENLVLRPNCLLTKSPLVFLTGARSLFYHQKMASELQTFIEAHGYQVISLPLPFRTKSLRRQVFQSWLKRNEEKSFHFFMGPETFNEFKDPLQNQLKKLNSGTINVIGDTFPVMPIKKRHIPLGYRLHELFCRAMGSVAEKFEHTSVCINDEDYDRFLDHCVQLAEDEMVANN